RRARGRAYRLHVKLLQPRAARGEFVDVGRFDVAAVKADVGPPLIVGQDEKDIWPRGLRRLGRPEQARTGQPRYDDTKCDSVKAGATHVLARKGTRLRAGKPGVGSFQPFAPGRHR